MTGINFYDIPADRIKDVTYYTKQVREKIDSETKLLKRRVRGCVGGNLINYPDDISANTADMTLVKMHIQSAVSNDEHYITADIKDFYLGTPLPRAEYIQIPVKDIPAVIMAQFNLTPLIHNGKVYFRVDKGMYGLPQAGILAQDRLVKHLADDGYIQSLTVPLLFKHVTRKISFTLVVDNFGIKYKDKADIDHLIATLRKQYEITIDWEGSQYLGMTLEFDRVKRKVTYPCLRPCRK